MFITALFIIEKTWVQALAAAGQGGAAAGPPAKGEGGDGCTTLCDPMDCSPPGSSVHGILQARILAWVAMPSSRGSS